MNDMIFWICWKWHEKEVGLRSTGGASGLEIGCPMGSTGKPENLRLYRMKLLVLFCVLIRSCTNFYLLTFNFFTQYSCTNTKIRPAPPIFLLSLHPIYNLAQCWKKATKNCNLHNTTFFSQSVDAEFVFHQYHHYRCTVAGKVINAAIMDTLA